MPKEFSRNERMAEQIRRDLSELVQNELKDPRIDFPSLTAVKLSRDLGHAVVYCTVMDEARVQETLDALNGAAGFLRKRIASIMKARAVPEIKFVHDDSVIRGAAMEDLIRKAISSDQKHDSGNEDE